MTSQSNKKFNDDRVGLKYINKNAHTEVQALFLDFLLSFSESLQI